jgi:hypothetical protein
MPTLTRRRYTERPDCWHAYYGDVHAGTIAIRVGCPHDKDPWEWSCGFYPGSRPGEIQAGTAKTFDQARAEFEEAWRVFLVNRNRGGFPGVAPSTRSDREEICHVGARREASIANPELEDALPVR